MTDNDLAPLLNTTIILKDKKLNQETKGVLIKTESGYQVNDMIFKPSQAFFVNYAQHGLYQASLWIR